MSIWPFLTIFTSLVLILFFRRIDKRTINFNKFRRYAEKLSKDFENFLNQKKEELNGSLTDLDNVLKKAAQMLARLEMEEEELKEVQTKVNKERDDLDAVKKEMKKLESLRAEITKEVDDVQRQLPSFKKLSRRVRKIGLSIVENEKKLKNATSIIPSLEQSIHNRTNRVIQEVKETILEETRNFAIPVVNEYRETLDMLKSAHTKIIEEFKRETQGAMDKVNLKIKEMGTSFETCRERVRSLESDVLFSIEGRINELGDSVVSMRGKLEKTEKETMESFLKQAEEQYGRYIESMEEVRSNLKKDIFQKIEDQAKDLSSYVTRLEGRVQNLLKGIKEETDKYAEVLELKSRATQSEVDVLKNRVISEINEEVNKNLLLIKPMVSEVNEKLVSYRKEFSSILEKMKESFEVQNKAINGEIIKFNNELEKEKNILISQLEEKFRNVSEGLEQVNLKMDEKVKNASEGVGRKFVEQLREYEKEISALEGRIGDLKNIAGAGQKMIEAKIESVFLNYQPEIVGKINSLREETEKLFIKEKESVLNRIEELIKNTQDELDRREEELNLYFGRMNEALKVSEQKLRKQEDEVQEEVGKVKLEARQELVRELENLKSLFKGEKERVVTGYSRELEGLSMKIEDLGRRVDDIHGIVEEKVQEAVKEAQKHLGEMEISYVKTGEGMTGQVKESLKVLSSEIEDIRSGINSLKKEVEEEIREIVTQYSLDLNREFSDKLSNLREREEAIVDLVKKLSEEAKARIEQSQVSAEEVMEKFQKQVEDTYKKVEQRIFELEVKINSFEKETSIIKRAGKFKERVEQDIEKLNEIMLQLKEDKKDINGMKKVIDRLKKDEGDITARVRQLKGDKKLVYNIAKNAEHAIGLISMVDEKINFIEKQGELLEKIENGIKGIEEQFRQIEEKSGVLSEKEADLNLSIEAIAKTKELVGTLEKRTEILKESFEEIKGIEEDVKRRLTLTDDKTREIIGRNKQIEDVLSKFQQMDSLVVDIETRTKQLQATREWLARTESRLTTLSQDADRMIGELKSLLEKTAGIPGAKSGGKTTGAELSRESESKVKTVLTLFDQKWTIPEICKVTKMSRGEVELILELNNR